MVDLFADAPSARPQPAAYLLAAYAAWFPPGTVFLCVVDPGVGGARAPLIVKADRRWYVGPDNGLFEIVLRRAARARVWRIAFEASPLSASFHGRDLFAPVAADLARGERPHGKPHRADVASRLAGRAGRNRLCRSLRQCDHRAACRRTGARDQAGRRRRCAAAARTFSDVPRGVAFCYENANGLMEIAVNSGRADDVLGLRIGSKVTVEP